MEDFPPWAWAGFGVALLSLLTLDLFAHRGGREESQRWAMIWTVIWIGAGLAFGGLVYLLFGARDAGDYIAAYLIEKSLSVDNLFVFLLIFTSLKIPPSYQRRVLSWGIFGALVMRGFFIFIGAQAISRHHEVVYVFAAILLYAAYRTFKDDPLEEKESSAAVFLSKHLPVTTELHGSHFLVKEKGKWVATPLMIAMLGLELTDLAFAIDSVPAAFSVTKEPFIIYSSNAFAILGLRSLYLVMARMLARLRYLHYGLAAILTFAAVKLLVAEIVDIPWWLSIGIILGILAISTVASLRSTRPPRNISDDSY